MNMETSMALNWSRIAAWLMRALDAILFALWRLFERLVRLLLALLRPFFGALFRAAKVLGRSAFWKRIAKSPEGEAFESFLLSPLSRAVRSMLLDGMREAVGILDGSAVARRLLFAGLGLFLLRGCFAYEGRVDGPWAGYSSRCVASYYEKGFLGKLTANGEIYSPFEMTAAHRKLPFGTWVRVRNLENGAVAIVRINDRGPYIEGRDIDLSKAAARKIGIVARGLAKVELEILSKSRRDAP